MKDTKGILLIAGTSLVTFLVWYFAALEQPIVPLDRARHIIAALALNGFLLDFLLATRNKTLEKWFVGLDKLYVYHKYIGIGTVGLLLVHTAMNELLKTSDVSSVRTASGGIALFALVILVGITLFARNLPYERWHHTHKFMLLPYVIGLAHTYLSSRVPLLEFSGVSIWTAETALIGLWSAIFVIFFAEKEHFKYTGMVTNISRLSPKVIEWEITLKKSIQFIEGQFIFVKVFQPGLDHEPHPFSISGGDRKKIYLTTKIAGDFTRDLYNSLALHSCVAIEGPYGNLNFSQAKNKQLWVAGGIGITPFMSYLREDHPDQEIELYYSFQGAEAGVYKDFISDYERRNKSFHAHFIDTSQMKPLSFEGYSLANDIDVFMCGPEKMIKGYAEYFKNSNKNATVRYEAFQLR